MDNTRGQAHHIKCPPNSIKCQNSCLVKFLTRSVEFKYCYKLTMDGIHFGINFYCEKNGISDIVQSDSGTSNKYMQRI